MANSLGIAFRLEEQSLKAKAKYATERAQRNEAFVKQQLTLPNGARYTLCRSSNAAAWSVEEDQQSSLPIKESTNEVGA